MRKKNPSAQIIATVIFPWGKYSYQRLPMAVAGAPDIFQSKISALMEGLEYLKTHLNNLLVLTKGSFKEYLKNLRAALKQIRDAGLRVKAPKSTFAAMEIEYLGCILTTNGVKPQPEKIHYPSNRTSPECKRTLQLFGPGSILL